MRGLAVRRFLRDRKVFTCSVAGFAFGLSPSVYEETPAALLGAAECIGANLHPICLTDVGGTHSLITM